jgi:hypothetical protein
MVLDKILWRSHYATRVIISGAAAVIVTLDQTENFTIEYQDSFPDALRRARALRQSCESKFATLRQWFGVTKGFGPSDRVTLQVETAYLGSNNGYDENGKTKVIVNPFDTQHFLAPGEIAVSQADADDAVLGLFVAEIAEVLMSYNNKHSPNTLQSWNPGGSDGEGLSRVCAALFHPAGYYNVLRGGGVNPWLQSRTSSTKRNDWIAKTEPSDKNVDSYGCSIIFIYYMHTQLGISMQSIITSASSPSHTLEQTYHVLTGLADGYTAITQLLDNHFPVGSTAALRTDNPFRLLDPIGRRVVLNFIEDATGPATVDSTGTATLSPYPPNCPVGTYKYTISNIPSRLRCSAAVTGFGQPVYLWRINGQSVSGSGVIDTTVRIEIDDPQSPDRPKTADMNVTLVYNTLSDASTYDQQSAELVITNVGFPGHFWLNIEVSVSETLGPSVTTVQSGSGKLNTQRLDYEERFRRDRSTCQAALRNRIEQIRDFRAINILLTLPDPSPEVMSAVHVIRELRQETAALTLVNKEAGREVIATLSHILELPAQVLS